MLNFNFLLKILKCCVNLILIFKFVYMDSSIELKLIKKQKVFADVKKKILQGQKEFPKIRTRR